MSPLQDWLQENMWTAIFLTSRRFRENCRGPLWSVRDLRLFPERGPLGDAMEGKRE